MLTILHLADDFFRKEEIPILIVKRKLLKLLFNLFNRDINECLKRVEESIVLKFHLIIQDLFY